jgi:hypothetical protein
MQTGQKINDGSTGLRWLTQFHENPKVIALWLSLTGPALKWLTPSRRRLILAAGAVLVALKSPAKEILKSGTEAGTYPDVVSSILVVASIFGILWFCYKAALHFASLPAFIRSNPQLSLHMLFWALLIVLWNTSPEAGIWRMVLVGLAILLPYFLWRVGYMFISAKRGKVVGTRFTDHLMYLWPAYGGSNTPYGKGLEYLSRNEAKDETALARSQLAGIKLLLLAVVWNVVNEILNGLVFGVDNTVKQAMGGFSLNVPHLKQLLGQSGSASIGLSWACLYFELIRDVLSHAAKGHVIIGVVRIFGFNVFRNTYKPLLAVSVVEFWNRYYYYFKEIMADFFFYPTFMGWFRKWPVLRLFAAVFMAAFVGNMYYHLIKMSVRLTHGDFQDLWDLLHPRLFYCFLLAAGIFISMMREQRRAGQPRANNILRRGLSIFGVWTFFAVISIWNQKGAGSFMDVTKFFLKLIGFA